MWLKPKPSDTEFTPLLSRVPSVSRRKRFNMSQWQFKGRVGLEAVSPQSQRRRTSSSSSKGLRLSPTQSVRSPFFRCFVSWGSVSLKVTQNIERRPQAEGGKDRTGRRGPDKRPAQQRGLRQNDASDVIKQKSTTKKHERWQSNCFSSHCVHRCENLRSHDVKKQKMKNKIG